MARMFSELGQLDKEPEDVARNQGAEVANQMVDIRYECNFLKSRNDELHSYYLVFGIHV